MYLFENVDHRLPLLVLMRPTRPVIEPFQPLPALLLPSGLLLTLEDRFLGVTYYVAFDIGSGVCA